MPEYIQVNYNSLGIPSKTGSKHKITIEKNRNIYSQNEYMIENGAEDLITTTKIFDEIYKQFLSNYSFNTVIDATACVGGETIPLVLRNVAKKVYSFEKEQKYCDQLFYNSFTVAKVRDDQIRIKNMDFVKWLNDQATPSFADAVFVDPPWGKEFEKKETQQLYLSEVEIMDIVQTIFDKDVSRNVFLKLPYTYDISRVFKYFKNNFKIHSISNWVLYVHIYKSYEDFIKLPKRNMQYYNAQDRKRIQYS